MQYFVAFCIPFGRSVHEKRSGFKVVVLIGTVVVGATEVVMVVRVVVVRVVGVLVVEG